MHYWHIMHYCEWLGKAMTFILQWGLISWFQAFPTASGHLLVRQCKTASWVAAFTPQLYLLQCPTASRMAISTLSPPPWKEPLLATWLELQLNHTRKMPDHVNLMHLCLSHPTRMLRACLLILSLIHLVRMRRVRQLNLDRATLPKCLIILPKHEPLLKHLKYAVCTWTWVTLTPWLKHGVCAGHKQHDQHLRSMLYVCRATLTSLLKYTAYT